MNRILPAAVIAVVLFLGPTYVLGLLEDFARAAHFTINDAKPAKAKLAQARREIRQGNRALAKTQVELARIHNEQGRLRSLLARVPMPQADMQRRHEELRRLVDHAAQTGQRIRYAGQDLTTDQMLLVLVKQRAYLASAKQHNQALANLETLERQLEVMVVQAQHEKALAQANLEYASILTRVASAASRTTGPVGGVHPYGNARSTLRELIALQETTLSVNQPTTLDGSDLFTSGHLTR